MPPRGQARGVTGWIADMFRFGTGLFYWNARKSWFQIRRGGQSRCPCQSPSDSGEAFVTHCDASLGWSKPQRFRRVCPLLVATPAGLRCSVSRDQVRPFWGRALGWYAGASLSLYILGAVSVFALLRGVGYPVSLAQVTWPGLWYHIPQARAAYFLSKSNNAFRAGRAAEGLLYLSNAHEFAPQNYAVSLALAKHYQAGEPLRSDQIFEQLLRSEPAHRDATSQEWFRALLARGDFAQIVPLARQALIYDSPHAPAWIRALLFASRETHEQDSLRTLASDPATATWHRLFETELIYRAGADARVRSALENSWPRESPLYTIVYRVSRLAEMHDTTAAIDLLESNANRIDDETRVTLRLDTLAAGNASRLREQDIAGLLNASLNLPTIKVLCAHLIRYPEPGLFHQLAVRVDRAPPPRNTDTAGIWFSLICAAGAVGDYAQFSAWAGTVSGSGGSPGPLFQVLEKLFRGPAAERNLGGILPYVPLPIEVTYALYERYSPAEAGRPWTSSQ